MQNTYYLIVRSDKGDLSMNQNFDALKIEGFTQEIDFTFLKEVTNLPVKKSRLMLDNNIRIEKIDCNLTASLLNFFLEVLNMYRAMVWASSIKAKIAGQLLNEDFLKNNVLHSKVVTEYSTKVGTESYERNILQIYKPQRYQDKIESTFKLQEMKLRIARNSREKSADKNQSNNGHSMASDAYRQSFGNMS